MQVARGYINSKSVPLTGQSRYLAQRRVSLVAFVFIFSFLSYLSASHAHLIDIMVALLLQ